MADSPESQSFFEWVFDWLKAVTNQIYFLRFPILTALAMVGLPYLGLVAELKSLLASLFVSNARGVFLISAVAFTTAGTILVTWRLIAAHGKARFERNGRAAGLASLPELPDFSIRLWQALLAGITALPVTVAVIYKTLKEAPEVGKGWAVLAAVLGLAAALGLFFLAALVQLLVNSEGRAKQLARDNFIVRWLPESVIDWLTCGDPAQERRRRLRKLLKGILGPGFFDESSPSSSGGRFLPGHGLAASLLVLSLLVFILAGQFSQYEMPALFFVILLLMLLCWGLSGLSFLVDRYRIPVLGVIVLLGIVADPNYYYGVENGKQLSLLTPQQVIEADGPGPKQIIVVATEGGGIQAAAWTARVLTGLQAIRPEFGKALRVISSVSGGSTGALYFVNGYNQTTGTPDSEALDLIVQMAADNSLDAVARGLVYHDFIHTLIPLWELGDDRGTALERAWAANCQKACLKYEQDHPGQPCPLKMNCEMTGTLAGWADLVKAGKLPANIFNGTMVETGDRLLISNSDVKKEREPGRLNIGELLEGKDIQALTSARLSASFPYVSPAARTELNVPIGGTRHVVDGGYYDNYGMTSLVEWLDKAFSDNLLSKVLVIQIQSFDDGPKASQQNQPNKPESRDDSGYVSQLLAPVYTLLHIRTAAQASHKELEFSLLKGKWPGKIENALFKFNCGAAPLTWKLTETEKRRIRDCWDVKHTPNNESVRTVEQFLDAMKPLSSQTN